MAYEEKLPADIEAAAVGGLGFMATINSTKAGFEDRNIEWERIRGRWNLRSALLRWKKNPAQMRSDAKDIQTLHVVCQGVAFGFRYHDHFNNQIGDPSDPTNDNQEIGVGDDSRKIFQIYSRFQGATLFYACTHLSR